jgi:phosphopantothenoylcysteine decarboxylase/phosphopantothenate--cysteine ligase
VAISHLALVQRADLYLIAPASANTLAKLATGQGDNLLCTAALAAICPVAVAPAMNDRMYAHPATQANLDKLRDRGVVVIGPGEGQLASHGEHGLGRLAEPEQLLEACASMLRGAPTQPWAGVRVLVTAGGTREPIDSVRFIGNRSSGRMGVALAARAAARGAEVTLIAANLAVPVPAGVRLVEVRTAAELAVAAALEFPRADVLLMAAAVADFRPSAPVDQKIKKDAGPPPAIELESTEDILSTLASGRSADQVIVGFAAEHGAQAAVQYGRSKRERKDLDLIVVNDISQADIGFDAESNEVVVLSSDGERHIPQSPKDQVADAVLDEVERLRRREVDGSKRAHAGSTRVG